eukprot:SAG31_NODE_12833_length_913_cov_1.851351_2_plen_84_part_00
MYLNLGTPATVPRECFFFFFVKKKNADANCYVVPLPEEIPSFCRWGFGSASMVRRADIADRDVSGMSPNGCVDAMGTWDGMTG